MENFEFIWNLFWDGAKALTTNLINLWESRSKHFSAKDNRAYTFPVIQLMP